MSSDALAKPRVSLLDPVKELFLQPRRLFQEIGGGQAQWQQSLWIALAAVLCNSVVALMVKGGLADSLLMAPYVVLVVAVYTGLLHFLGRWLLQAGEATFRGTSTAVNYATALAAVISVPYLGVAALFYFLYLLIVIAEVRFGASRGQAVVTLILFLLAALVFESFLSLFGLFD